MEYGGIFEPGSLVRAVQYAPLTSGAEVSKNGGPFVAVTNPPIAIGSDYFYVDLTAQETNTEGFLLLRFLGTAAETSLAIEIRPLVGTILRAVGVSLRNQVTDPLSASMTSLEEQMKGIVGKVVPSLLNIGRGGRT